MRILPCLSRIWIWPLDCIAEERTKGEGNGGKYLKNEKYLFAEEKKISEGKVKLFGEVIYVYFWFGGRKEGRRKKRKIFCLRRRRQLEEGKEENIWKRKYCFAKAKEKEENILRRKIFFSEDMKNGEGKCHDGGHTHSNCISVALTLCQ